MRTFTLCLLSCAVLAAGCSKKDEARPAPVTEPLRKAGLWSIETSMLEAGIPAPPTGYQLCIDAATDRQAPLVGGRMGPTAACTQTASKTEEGWTVKRICKENEHAVTLSAVISGDLDSEYSVDVSVVTAPPEADSTITGKWLSACGDDQKPGDVTLTSGLTYNVTKVGPPPAAPQIAIPLAPQAAPPIDPETGDNAP